MKTIHTTGWTMATSLLLLLSCGEKEETQAQVPVDPTFATQTEKHLIKVDTLYSDFESPWGMTWLSDGKMLVTERKGEILVFENDQFSGKKIKGLPVVHAVNQAGLLDVAAHPNQADNGWIYIAYAKPIGEDKGALTLMRFQLDPELNAINQEELIVLLPEWEGGRHYGSRIVFDGKGYLYFSNGDKGNMPENAQDLGNPHGKVHRIHDNGRIPTDNPFFNDPKAVPSIWSYGNRNPQGLYYDRDTDQLWETEHGPKGGDELNRIEKGKNYGWPVITYGINYNGTPITDITEKEGMEQPVTYYVPSIATCGMTMVTSDRYPEWKGDILIGALVKMHINRVDMDSPDHAKEVMFQDIGRVRQVSQSPDGYLYAITEGTGLLVKLLPAN